MSIFQNMFIWRNSKNKEKEKSNTFKESKSSLFIFMSLLHRGLCKSRRICFFMINFFLPKNRLLFEWLFCPWKQIGSRKSQKSPPHTPFKMIEIREVYPYTLTHCTLVDSSTDICWTSPFVILGVWDLFWCFNSIFDGKSC